VATTRAELSPKAAFDVAFHMTDWLEDLEQYRAFLLNPQSLGDDELNQLLIGFLVHVPNHLAAASKLFNDMAVTDIFGVGATTESVDEELAQQ